LDGQSGKSAATLTVLDISSFSPAEYVRLKAPMVVVDNAGIGDMVFLSQGACSSVPTDNGNTATYPAAAHAVVAGSAYFKVPGTIGEEGSLNVCFNTKEGALAGSPYLTVGTMTIVDKGVDASVTLENVPLLSLLSQAQRDELEASLTKDIADSFGVKPGQIVGLVLSQADRRRRLLAGDTTVTFTVVGSAAEMAAAKAKVDAGSFEALTNAVVTSLTKSFEAAGVTVTAITAKAIQSKDSAGAAVVKEQKDASAILSGSGRASPVFFLTSVMMLTMSAALLQW
jgi:hypothetical protein